MQFAQFVTGASRPCLPQMELLRITMPFVARKQEEWPRILNMLPQVRSALTLLSTTPSLGVRVGLSLRLYERLQRDSRAFV